MPQASDEIFGTVDAMFKSWWERVGRTLDPDTSDVPWHDKREGLAQLAFVAAFAISKNYVVDDAVEPHELIFANGRAVTSQGLLFINDLAAPSPTPPPETEGSLNHYEALQLAYVHRASSNLARCYIELRNTVDISPPPDARDAKIAEHDEACFALGAEIKAMRDDVIAQDEKIERLKAVLRHCEWGGSATGDYICPSCGSMDLDGHAPDCALSRELDG